MSAYSALPPLSTAPEHRNSSPFSFTKLYLYSSPLAILFLLATVHRLNSAATQKQPRTLNPYLCQPKSLFSSISNLCTNSPQSPDTVSLSRRLLYHIAEAMLCTGGQIRLGPRSTSHLCSMRCRLSRTLQVSLTSHTTSWAILQLPPGNIRRSDRTTTTPEFSCTALTGLTMHTEKQIELEITTKHAEESTLQISTPPKSKVKLAP